MFSSTVFDIVTSLIVALLSLLSLFSLLVFLLPPHLNKIIVICFFLCCNPLADEQVCWRVEQSTDSWQIQDDDHNHPLTTITTIFFKEKRKKKRRRSSYCLVTALLIVSASLKWSASCPWCHKTGRVENRECRTQQTQHNLKSLLLSCRQKSNRSRIVTN